MLFRSGLDSAGEPVLTPRVTRRYLTSSVVALVLRARGVEWPGWGRRPPGLVEALSTLDDGVPRLVLLQGDPAARRRAWVW